MRTQLRVYTILRGGGPCRKKPRPKRLDYAKVPAQHLAKHFTERTKGSRDRILREHIERIVRFQEASLVADLRIKEIDYKRAQERERKTTIRKRLEGKIKELGCKKAQEKK